MDEMRFPRLPSAEPLAKPAVVAFLRASRIPPIRPLPSALPGIAAHRDGLPPNQASGLNSPGETRDQPC